MKIKFSKKKTIHFQKAGVKWKEKVKKSLDK